MLDETTLGFADFRGNRQYISLGNIASNDRVCLFLMDYPNRARLKIYARMEARDLKADAALAEQLATPGYRGLAERAFILKLEAFDWNCSQHITPRFTAGRTRRSARTGPHAAGGVGGGEQSVAGEGGGTTQSKARHARA